jgi:hypothetical protein
LVKRTTLEYSHPVTRREGLNSTRARAKAPWTVCASPHGRGLREDQAPIDGVPYPRPGPSGSGGNLDGRSPPHRRHAKSRRARGTRRAPKRHPEKHLLFSIKEGELDEIDNDPSAGSPTETLLRLLLPLNAQVWESSRATLEA